MKKQVQRLVIGLGIVLVSLTGLITASALVPDVGCGNGTDPLKTGQTHISIIAPDQVATGQSFTVNGTLEKGLFPEPFAHQWVTISVSSKLFSKKVITDSKGHFSCDVVVNQSGTFFISANYHGDQAGHFQSSSSSNKIQVTGDVPEPDTPVTSGPSNTLTIIAIIVVVLLLIGFLVYRYFIKRNRPGEKPRTFPVWVWFILSLSAIGVVFISINSREKPVNETSGISQTLPGNEATGIPTRIVFHPPTKAKIGAPIHIQGVLWQWLPVSFETCFPISGQKIDILINGVPKVEGLITDKTGRFATEMVIEHGGQYQITVVYHGTEDRWQGYRVTDMMIVGSTFFLYWNSPGWLIVYGTLIVLVVLFDLYLTHRQKWGFAVSLLSRGFACALVVLECSAILYSFNQPWGIGIFKQGKNWSRLFTDISLVVPEKVQPEQEFSLSGTLKVAESPLPQQEVNIWLIKINDPSAIGKCIAILTTDDTGNFTDTIEVKSAGQYEISAVFDDTGETYIESRDPHTLTVGEADTADVTNDDDRNGFTWWARIFGIPFIISIIVTLFLIFRFRWNIHHVKRTKLLRNPVTKIPPSPSATPTSIHTSIAPINIEFPQINTPLPDVWGKDDNLLIIFTVAGTSHKLEQYSLDIEFGMDSTVRSPLSKYGYTSQEHIFRKTGKYHIQAVLVKDVRNGYIPASRLVRIVDYREEIVSLYNEMIAFLPDHGVRLTTKMTAREVENRVGKALPGLSNKTTNSLISIFEEANYSLHDISRTEYEKMYLAVKKIEEYSRGVTSE
jgi:hypothetical protein